MNIAFFGDIVGKSGRRVIAHFLPDLKKERQIDFVIANVENAAGGFGITEKSIEDLEKAGVDFFTSGNHIWDNKDGVAVLDAQDNIIRPANYPGEVPGNGYRIVGAGEHAIAIVNVQGRVFMPAIDCPFRAVDRIFKEVSAQTRVFIVDIHAEATSEKIAMGWHLDGRASLVVGTHTHVPTKDCRILLRGTGYVTDVGMSGSNDSVLGMEKEAVLQRFLQMRPSRFQVAKKDLRCDFVLAQIDTSTGRTVNIEHMQLRKED
ncbi:MAG: TIGR00282 family metallophosphoesterase [Candidatus Latescibacterota bacterium]